MYHYESLIKQSLYDGRIIHGEKMVSEWVRIRYESLVLIIKAVIILNRQIKIHPEHFYIEEPNEIIDKKFLEIPVKFRVNITEAISFDAFEPSINNICELLVPPSKLDLLKIDEMFVNKDLVSIKNYFINYATDPNGFLDNILNQSRINRNSNSSQKVNSNLLTLNNISSAVNFEPNLNPITPIDLRSSTNNTNLKYMPKPRINKLNVGSPEISGQNFRVKLIFTKDEVLYVPIESRKMGSINSQQIVNVITQKDTINPPSQNNSSYQTINIPKQPDLEINTNDKYFNVILTSKLEDGSTNYVTHILIKNFKQMFPLSYNAKAWIYSISTNEDTSLKLEGLIRYDSNNKHRITPKSSHIKNYIKSEYSQQKNHRPYNVESLTNYSNKRYITVLSKVIATYNYISRDNSSVGDPISLFIQND